jgi:hypothetical protein
MLHMHDMADAVAGARIPQTEAATGALQEEMIVSVQVVDLQQVVIDILSAALGARSIQADRLQRQHHQRAGRILCERLINADRDGLARTHLAVYEMGRDQLLGDILWHLHSLSGLRCPRFLIVFGY